MKIDWKRVKRNLKIEMATIVIGLFILPSFMFLMYGFIRICVDWQEYNHSIISWVFIGLFIVITAWTIGTWVIILLRKIILPKQPIDENLSP